MRQHSPAMRVSDRHAIYERRQSACRTGGQAPVSHAAALSAGRAPQPRDTVVDAAQQSRCCSWTGSCCRTRRTAVPGSQGRNVRQRPSIADRFVQFALQIRMRYENLTQDIKTDVSCNPRDCASNGLVLIGRASLLQLRKDLRKRRCALDCGDCQRTCSVFVHRDSGPKWLSLA